MTEDLKLYIFLFISFAIIGLLFEAQSYIYTKKYYPDLTYYEYIFMRNKLKIVQER